jgi:hypothetical protein
MVSALTLADLRRISPALNCRKKAQSSASGQRFFGKFPMGPQVHR